MKEITLTELKQIELDILDFIDAVCKENNLKYYLAYGTLLGAIRHKGFIPWDDDIDIYMLRQDYEKFINIVGKCHDRYKVLSMYNDARYYYEFAKVVDSHTSVETPDIINNGNEGVWVDIFPLDYTSSMLKVQKTIINICVACRILSVYKHFPTKHSRVLYPVWLISKAIGPRFFLRISDFFVKRGRNHEKVGYLSSVGVDKYFFDSKWCDNTMLVPFEGRQYPAFEAYDEYLKYQYGNYMELPPVDKRVSHPVTAYWKENCLNG